MSGGISLDDSRKRAGRHPFDADTLRLRGLRWVLAKISANLPDWVFGALRTLLPIAKLPGWRYLGNVPIPTLFDRWVLVTRNEDVKEVLERDDVFNVWWGAELSQLNDGKVPGTPFILGLDRHGAEAAQYYEGLAQVMTAFRRDDIASIVRPAAAERAQAAVADGRGRALDAIQELIVDVSLDTCSRYFGVRILGLPAALNAAASGGPEPDDVESERQAFYTWTVAASGLLFGPPFERDRALGPASAATDRLALIVDIAIDAATRANPPPGAPAPDTVLARLVAGKGSTRPPTPLMTRSIMLGMITGSVPTNAIAFSHILDVLLDQPRLMAAAKAAAHSGDDGLLTRSLFEAMRFKPLNPGPWRRTRQRVVLARGSGRETSIAAGTYVLASTQSAMFDPRSVKGARRFDPTRDPSDLLHFGHGLHWCVARYMAETQITEAFRALLMQPNLRRAPSRHGRAKQLGLFPLHQYVEFDTA